MASCKTQYGKPKIRHQDRGAAEAHASSIRKWQLHDVEAYRCPKCMFWHVGRIPERHRRKLERRKAEKMDEILVGKLIGALKQVLANK